MVRTILLQLSPLRATAHEQQNHFPGFHVGRKRLQSCQQSVNTFQWDEPPYVEAYETREVASCLQCRNRSFGNAGNRLSDPQDSECYSEAHTRSCLEFLALNNDSILRAAFELYLVDIVNVTVKRLTATSIKSDSVKDVKQGLGVIHTLVAGRLHKHR